MNDPHKNEHWLYGKKVDNINPNIIQRMNSLGLDKVAINTYDSVKQMAQCIEECFDPSMIKQSEKVVDSVVESLSKSNNILSTINRMICADPSLYNHSALVSIVCGVIANKINPTGFSGNFIQEAVKCGLFHDVGKSKISSTILLKEGKLTDEEFNEIKKHPKQGYIELKDLSELGKYVSMVALQHHERFDGTGYPHGKKGRYEDSDNGINIFSRICTIADVYAALIAKRSYKEAYSNEKTLDIMLKNMLNHFDPELLRVFINELKNSNVVNIIQDKPSTPDYKKLTIKFKA